MQQNHHQRHLQQPYPQTVQEDMTNYYRNYSFYQPYQDPVRPVYGFPVYPQPAYGIPVYPQPPYGIPVYPQPHYHRPMQPMYPNDNYIYRPQTLEWPYWVYEDQRENHPPRNRLQESDQQRNLPHQFDFEPEDTHDFIEDVLAYFMRIRTSEEDEFDALQEWIQYSRTINRSNLLEETIPEHLKTRKYQKDLENEESEICELCQCEYENEETIGTLECGHEYHADCIQRWLLRKNVCPDCKRPAIQQEG